jgi:hypothetical protein
MHPSKASGSQRLHITNATSYSIDPARLELGDLHPSIGAIHRQGKFMVMSRATPVSLNKGGRFFLIAWLRRTVASFSSEPESSVVSADWHDDFVPSYIEDAARFRRRWLSTCVKNMLPWT